MFDEDILFLLFGRGEAIYSSSDATTSFVKASIPADFYARDLTSGEGLYVAVNFEAKVITSPDAITFTQRTAAPGVGTNVEYSTDLADWFSNGVTFDAVPTGNAGFERVTARVTGVTVTSKALYMRVRWFFQ